MFASPAELAAATGDRQWIHTDPERAAAGPFGGPIAHGMLTLSLGIVLLAEVFRVDGVNLVLNKGFDHACVEAGHAYGKPGHAYGKPGHAYGKPGHGYGKPGHAYAKAGHARERRSLSACPGFAGPTPRR